MIRKGLQLPLAPRMVHPPTSRKIKPRRTIRAAQPADEEARSPRFFFRGELLPSLPCPRFPAARLAPRPRERPDEQPGSLLQSAFVVIQDSRLV